MTATDTSVTAVTTLHQIEKRSKSHPVFTSEGISIWNAKAGRHRGELTGCPTHINGVALLSNSETLVAGCNDGHIRFWDFTAALKQIATFEQSLDEGAGE